MGRFPRGLLLLAVLGALVAVGLALSPASVIERLGDLLYSPWFPLLLVGLYLLRPLLAWPITAISVLVGYRYGLVVGMPVALAGVVATSLVPYGTARYLRVDEGWVGWLTTGSERYFGATGHLRGVVAARLAPTPAEPVSAAAGVARVPVRAFVLGTLLGELPWTLVAVFAGDSMQRLSLEGALLDPRLVVAGLLAALLVLARPTYRYVRRRRGPRG